MLASPAVLGHETLGEVVGVDGVAELRTVLERVLEYH